MTNLDQETRGLIGVTKAMAGLAANMRILEDTARSLWACSDDDSLPGKAALECSQAVVSARMELRKGLDAAMWIHPSGLEIKDGLQNF